MRATKMTVAQKRYHWRFFPTMTLYVVFLIGAMLLVKHGLVHEAVLIYCLAVLPALPLLGVIVIVGLYLVEEKDEFERTVLVQTMLWATGGTLAFTTVWGFLEMFAGAVPHHAMAVAHLQPFWLFPLFMFLMGASTPLVRLRYR